MRIYVGNLPWSTTDDELRGLFEAFGQVTEHCVVVDQDTGRSRGYGFLTMLDDDGAEAIKGLDQSKFGGRTINVTVAKEKQRRNGTSGGSGRRSPPDHDW